MIAQAYLNQWATRAPWPVPAQVEQDLVLSRLIVEIAQHDLLGSELALRGGTCLHKLHLPQPLRYSEDLDYVRRTHSGIKPYLTALRDIATRVGLIVSRPGFDGDGARPKSPSNTGWLRATPVARLHQAHQAHPEHDHHQDGATPRARADTRPGPRSQRPRARSRRALDRGTCPRRPPRSTWISSSISSAPV